ncbi:MAG: hypothetical protein V1787_05360 [Candidatus Micrarchaeota archaeon]
MDFFSHVAWAYILFPHHDPHLFEVLLFSVLPDILFVGAALLYSVNLFARTRRIEREKAFPFVRTMYRVAHSVFTAASLFVILSLVTGGFYYPVLAMVLHIMLDLYTHRGSPVEPQMPLYPLARPSVRGWIWWRHPVFLAANWALIALFFFWH